MTEAEWLSSNDPTDMLNSCSDTRQRRLRLFAVGCCRRWWPVIESETCAPIIEAAERFADGLIGKDELAHAEGTAHQMSGPYPLVPAAAMAAVSLPFHPSQAAVVCDCLVDAVVRRQGLQSDSPAWRQFINSESRQQAQLLRDIFGNPFRPVNIDLAWLRWHKGTIPKVIREAQSMYDSRDFASMPILADALEEAGCTSADILDHCRWPGPHVRGCWVVDLMLGKS